MKIRIPCFECNEKAFKADKEKETPYIPTYAYWEHPTIEVDKWPYFEVECPKGHVHRYILNLELYEVLFQQATYCLQDGYYREAVCTYNTSLERFFEYVIEILFYYNNFEMSFSKIWSQICNQSERQLGAYYLIWSTTVMKEPFFLDDKMVKLRNQVVHKGKLVRKEKAMEFGEYVFNGIKSASSTLHELIDEEEFAKLNAMRMFRINGIDIKKAEEHPITSIVDGETIYEGIGGININCFLKDNEVKSYEDCFNTGILNNQYIGFTK